MAFLGRFDTPASLRDVAEDSPFYQHWSDHVSQHMQDRTVGDNGGAFYNPTKINVGAGGEKAMVWMGFPRKVLFSGHKGDKRTAFRSADEDIEKRSKQNEYFEWRVERNDHGKITKVTFVTEFREYFEQLWQVDRSAVVDIYRSTVSHAVQESDLHHDNGEYNVFNRWNTTDGIMHYIQDINNLTAAIGLCEDSVRSTRSPYRDNYEASPAYATAKTSVDPRIAYDVHMLVRKGLYVTLKEPIGFYIADWNNAGVARPDGRPAPARWWKIKRGKPGMVLRLEYDVPHDEGLVVGDLELGGRPIEYGSQLAEEIAVVIHGTAGTVVGGR